MSLVRFVHTADLHLDSPFQGIRGKVPSYVMEVLREATFAAYDQIVDLCIQKQVDACLVAGDVYDSADRSLRAQIRFVSGLERLDAAGVRTFICHGNHDPTDGWEARLALPPSCVRFGVDVGTAPVFPDDPHRAAVHGISYPRSVVEENLALRFHNDTNASAASHVKYNIGLLHATVGGNTGHPNYSPCTIEDLIGTAFDYWALGHVHTRQVLREERPTIVYPGNPQGRHPLETDRRGVYIVDVAEDGLTVLDFVETDVVRWELLTVGIAELETEQDIMNTVESMVAESAAAADGRDVVFRLDFVDRGPLHRWLALPETRTELMNWLNGLYAERRPWMWCERINTRTSALVDRERAALRDDFVGDMLRTGAAIRSEPDLLQELQDSLRPLYVNSSAGPYLRDFLPSIEEVRLLLTDAENHCLDSLAGEEELE
ncbi:MAG: DNA repair exonuclease [Gemmatimonadota bacterium]|nr:DNA repair exonuclease [Gemmatimonadota bacterium]